MSSEDYEPTNQNPEDDENDESTNSTKINILPCALMVVNAALGAGMLNFPYAFKLIGNIYWALGLQVVAIGFAFFGMIALAKGVDYQNENDDERLLLQSENNPENVPNSYEKVVQKITSKPISITTETCIILYTFGTCITFLVVIGDQIESSIPCTFLSNARIVGIIAICPILLLLLFPKDISFLKNVSVLGVVSVFLVAFLVVYRCFVPVEPKHLLMIDWNCRTGSTLLKAASETSTPEFSSSLTGLLQGLPTIAFAYQCHISAVPIYATTLKNRTTKRWSYVLFIAFLLIFSINSTTGIFGYLHFKENTLPDILSNFNNKDPFVIIARSFMGLCMVGSYPLLAFCGRLSILNLVGRFIGDENQENNDDDQPSKLIFNSLTIIWVFSTTLIAIFLPDISSVISVIGNLAVCFMMVFPGLVGFYVEEGKKFRQVFAVMMVVLGLVVFVTCMVQNFVNM